MRDFVKPDSTVIERVIYYSILLRDIKITLLQLRKTKIMMRGLGIMNLNFNDLNENELKLIHHEEEIQNACRQLLTPLFENIDFGHRHLNHWAIPMYDIKQGFCELQEILKYKEYRPLIFGRQYVLLLRDYIDPTLGKFYSGELIESSKAIHFIDKIPPKTDKVKGLYDAIRDSIMLATRHRSKNIQNE